MSKLKLESGKLINGEALLEAKDLGPIRLHRAV